MLKVVNLLSGAGARKSTIAHGLMYQMKKRSQSVEFVSETAKDLTHERHFNILEDQIMVFADQQRRIRRLVGHYEWAIADTCTLLGVVYGGGKFKYLDDLILDQFSHYQNYNFFIHRSGQYDPVGRNQTEEGAREKDYEIRDLLNLHGISYHDIYSGDTDAAIEQILRILKIR